MGKFTAEEAWAIHLSKPAIDLQPTLVDEMIADMLKMFPELKPQESSDAEPINSDGEAVGISDDDA